MPIDTATQTIRGTHSVHFYLHDVELAQSVGDHLARAIEAGRVALVIAVAERRQALEAELRARGIDLAAAEREGRFVALDAAQALAGFCEGGQIDPARFDRSIGDLVRTAVGDRGPASAYGEMVALLWNAGHVIGAIELEQLWNGLARELEFDLLCGYQSEAVAGAEHAESVCHVCDLHSAVTRTVSREFPAHPGAPHGTREFVSETLRGWGYGGSVLDDARLVVSELATNAVLYSQNAFSVIVASEGSTARISVLDCSSDRPEPAEPELSTFSGRGLQVVGALADGWGVEEAPVGKRVWAQLQG